MDSNGLIIRLVCLLALAAVSGCTPTPDSDPPPSSDTAATTAAPVAGPESSNRAVLPGLFELMEGLEGDMAGIARGVWREQLDTVAHFARAVTGHPAEPAEEAEAIARVLGPDMAGFEAIDGSVHDLAMRLAEAAARGDFPAVLEADAGLRAGCVLCHTTFRTRLREALR